MNFTFNSLVNARKSKVKDLLKLLYKCCKWYMYMQVFLWFFITAIAECYTGTPSEQATLQWQLTYSSNKEKLQHILTTCMPSTTKTVSPALRGVDLSLL